MSVNTSAYEQYVSRFSGKSTGIMKLEAERLIKGFQQRKQVVSRFAPVTFAVDFAANKHIHVEESCFDLLGYTSDYLLEMDFNSWLDKVHPACSEIINTSIFSHDLAFLQSITNDEYADHVFSYNFKIENAAGNFINVLQRFSFVPGTRSGEPVGIIGVIIDITHFKNDNTIIHTVEKVDRFQEDAVNTLVYKKVYSVYEVGATLPMTVRELEILRLMADGFGSKQIAHELKLSANTINNHRKNMLQKASCSTSSELLSHAVKHGLL